MRNLTLLATAAIIATSLGCANKLIKKPLDEKMMGKLDVQEITITKGSTDASDEAIARIKSAIEAELKGKPKGEHAAVMNINLEKWKVPGETGAAKALGKLLGSKSEIIGMFKITDKSGNLLSEYQTIAGYEEGGLLGSTTTVSFVNVEKQMTEQFARFALDPIY